MTNRLASALLALTILGAPSALAGSTRAIVIDDHAFRVVDLLSGRTVQQLALPAGRQHVVYSKDLTRLLVFSPSAVTFIDAQTLSPIGSADIGGDVNDVLTISDDAMYVLTKRRLLELDVRRGQVRQELAFDRDTRELDLLPDGKTALVYIPGDAKRGVGAEMRFVDRGAFRQNSAVTLSPRARSPIAFRGSRYFYSIDPGDGASGKLFVLTKDNPSLLASLDVGADAKIAAALPESERIVLFSRRPGEGYVHIIREGTMEKNVAFDFEPVFIDARDDIRSATVTGRSFRGVLGIHAMRQMPLDLSGIELTNERPVLLETLEGAKQDAIHRLERCCGTLDHSIEVAERVGQVADVLEGPRTGSIVRAGTIAGAIAVAMFSEPRIPPHISEPALFTDFYDTSSGPSVDRGRYFLRRDGRVDYSLVPGNRLIIANAADHRIIAKIGVDDGLQEMVTLGDEETLAVIGDDRVAVVDLRTNRRTGIFKAGGDVHGFAVSPDSRYGAAIGEDKVTFIDGRTSDVLTTVHGVSGKIDVIYAD